MAVLDQGLNLGNIKLKLPSSGFTLYGFLYKLHYFVPITILAGFSFIAVIVFIRYGMSLKLDVSSKEKTEHIASTLSLHA